MQKALWSGELAANAILDGVNGDLTLWQQYENKSRGLFEHYMAERQKYYLHEKRWHYSPFWYRRHGRITLDPKKILKSSDFELKRKILRFCLSQDDLQLLAKLFESPKCASDGLMEFLKANQGLISTARGLEAIQYLINEGVLV